MANHPNRSAAKVQVCAAAQGHSLVYVDGKLAAGITTDANGRWIMRRLIRDGSETKIAGAETLNVTGIYHNAAELNRAVRLFVAHPAAVAAAWPASGFRAQCRDAMDRLAQARQ